MKFSYYSSLTKENFKIDNKNWVYDDQNPDIVFSIGGDGTMLGAVDKYQNKLDSIKFVGINAGKLGFFSGFKKDELSLAVEQITNKSYIENEFSLLEYTIENHDFKISGYALNDVVILNPIHTQILDVYIDNELFETFRGTGLVLCPPAGSTAYNKSLNGSVIDPLVPCFQLTEFASINNSVYRTLSSSLVLSKNRIVKIKPHEANNLHIVVDGQPIECIDIKDVRITLSNKKAVMISSSENFFDKLNRAFIK